MELCNAKWEWIALSDIEREKFLEPIPALMKALQENGVEIISWSVIDLATPERAPYDYVAIFRFPNDEALQEYYKIFTDYGWYQYFDQDNVMADIGNFLDVQQALLLL